MSGIGKAAVRCNAVSMSGLVAMETHGKRQDKTSKKRVIRKDKPVVYGSLDLRDRYDEHMKGVKQNAAALKPVLHFIFRFPPELLDGPEIGRFKKSKHARQKEMLAQAIKFTNDTHGGNAVFAARLDRDELGETIVDVFAAPKYEKRTKRTKVDEQGVIWASATKFGKELAEKHEPELRKRHPEAKSGKLTSPRMVGIALQSEFHEFFERINGVALVPKLEKWKGAPDRIEKEAHDRLESVRADLEAERRLFDEQAETLEKQRQDLAGKLDRLDASQASIEAERSRLKDLSAHMKATQEAAVELLKELRGRADLPRAFRNDLVQGLRDLRDALKQKKPMSERERIVRDIESSIPERFGEMLDQAGPGL